MTIKKRTFLSMTLRKVLFIMINSVDAEIVSVVLRPSKVLHETLLTIHSHLHLINWQQFFLNRFASSKKIHLKLVDNIYNVCKTCNVAILQEVRRTTSTQSYHYYRMKKRKIKSITLQFITYILYF